MRGLSLKRGRKTDAGERKNEEVVVSDKLGEISLCCYHASVIFDKGNGHNL